VDSHAESCHPHLYVSALGLNWHVGLDKETNSYCYGYDFLNTLPCPEKQNRISVICSSASKTEGQRQRLRLLDGLKQRLGDRLVHFGRGFEQIGDKMDAMLPYRYHLVLENSVLDNYWTEKRADAYLGWSYPVYLGCPNVADYLPERAHLSINALDAGSAAARIEQLLDMPLLPEQLDAMEEARYRILNVYNPFAWAAYWATRLHNPDLGKRRVTLRSHKAFRSFLRGYLFRVRQASS